MSQATPSIDVDDARLVAAYLVAPGSDDYVAIMEVLETSVEALVPREIGAALILAGRPLTDVVLQDRLDQLDRWGALVWRTDGTQVLRHADLLARNYRYTATPVGRQVQRFYRVALAGAPVLREIPLRSLAVAVQALRELVDESQQADPDTVDRIARLFVSHDNLDGGLVGAEDALMELADRFDLDGGGTADLKELLVSYASRVAVELERGGAQASALLDRLSGRFDELSSTAVAGSEGRDLIARGALSAARGGRPEDWAALRRWFDPGSGRAAAFSMRLVRALPGMHVNIRRLHTSTGVASSRARALALARACLDDALGPAIFAAAMGDHQWRKLHSVAPGENEGPRTPEWRKGPAVDVPALLRATGRSGGRGRPPAGRDGSSATRAVAERRERRQLEHAEALAEVLSAQPGSRLSAGASSLAYGALLRTVRSAAEGGHRSAVHLGLACTIVSSREGVGVLTGPNFRVLLPGRTAVFHAPGAQVVLAESLSAKLRRAA